MCNVMFTGTVGCAVGQSGVQQSHLLCCCLDHQFDVCKDITMVYVGFVVALIVRVTCLKV